MLKKDIVSLIQAFIEQGIDPVSKENELWERFGKRYAILVIDASGFTRTTKKHGIIYFLSKLAQKRAIAVPILEANDCISHVMESDSIIALFPDVESAMNTALSLHEGIKDSQLMLSDDEPFRICAGVGYGDMLVTGAHGDFYGTEVNLASKLGEDSADPGELMLTQSAYEAIPSSMQGTFIEKSVTVSDNHISYYLKHM